jgi:hypothetical protein
VKNNNEHTTIEQLNISIDNIQKIGKKILDLKYKFEQIELDMNIDRNYAAKLFAMRQFEQLKAMFALSDNENHILISRSMFEGVVYIGCFLEDFKLAKDWRNYAFVVDQMRIDNGDKASNEVMELLKNKKTEIDKFKNKKGKFYHSWNKDKSIKELSSIAKLEDFYDKYYSCMSDFHHWGTRSFGIRYECLEKNINRLNTAETKLESLMSWCMSVSSIVNTLSILSILAKNSELNNKLAKLGEELSKLDGMNITKIIYSNRKKD